MTELILAAWAVSAVLLFLPVGRAARLVARRLRPAGSVSTGGGSEPEGSDARRLLPASPDVGGIAVPPSRAIPTLAPHPFSVGSIANEGIPSAAPAVSAPAEPPQSRRLAAAAGALALLRWVPTLALYVVFIAGSIYLAPRIIARVLDTDHPMAAVTSQSMYPTLKRGDLVLIQGVDKAADLEVGDIVAFQSENATGLVIHRIVAIDGATIVTQGDANENEDAPITFEQVIGRALTLRSRLAKLPYLGNIPILFGGTTTVDDEQPDEPVAFEGETR